MKRILSYFFIIITLASSAQNNIPNFDSLFKYTYDIKAWAKKDSFKIALTGGGTGFFIRYHSRLYFVTARHVLTGCWEHKQNKRLSDTMTVYIPDGDKKYGLNIPVKKIKDTAHCKSFWEEADILILPVAVADTSFDSYIYSLENLIAPNAFTISDILIIGYPVVNINFDKKIKPPSIYTIKEGTWKLALLSDSIGRKDTLNLAFEIPPITFKSSDLDGYSGSPAFTQNKETNQWIMIGIFISTKMVHNPEVTDFVFVSRKTLLRELLLTEQNLLQNSSRNKYP